MSTRRRNDARQFRKDQRVREEVRSEIGSEIVQDGSAPLYRNLNRDQARGDWDRTGRRTDEDRSRDAGRDGDEGLRPK